MLAHHHYHKQLVDILPGKDMSITYEFGDFHH